jgi:hypothetical protein
MPSAGNSAPLIGAAMSLTRKAMMSAIAAGRTACTSLPAAKAARFVGQRGAQVRCRRLSGRSQAAGRRRRVCAPATVDPNGPIAHHLLRGALATPDDAVGADFPRQPVLEPDFRSSPLVGEKTLRVPQLALLGTADTITLPDHSDRR